MEETLKRCPFCGGQGVFMTGAASGENWIICGECNAEGPYASNRKDALDRWNKRKEVPDGKYL